MEVRRFTDEHEVAAALYGLTPEELLERDAAHPSPRWIALADGGALAAVSAFSRPDGRLFLRFAGGHHSAWASLVDAVAGSFGPRRLCTLCDEDDVGAVEFLHTVGFETESTSERFRVRFDEALASCRRARIPSGFSIRSADTVVEERLFTLDNTIRQDVPGCDGWRGDRSLFHDELTDAPPFDPGAYQVAVDERNGEYVGLVRIWRNSNGPRFGLIGVIRQYRNTSVAAALLEPALTAAATWGHDTFVTETSSPALLRRLQRLGARSEGRFLQLVRR